MVISKEMLSQLSSKLTGARTKYTSKSQHQRLAQAPHFADKVVVMAGRFVTALGQE